MQLGIALVSTINSSLPMPPKSPFTVHLNGMEQCDLMTITALTRITLDLPCSQPASRLRKMALPHSHWASIPTTRNGLARCQLTPVRLPTRISSNLQLCGKSLAASKGIRRGSSRTLQEILAGLHHRSCAMVFTVRSPCTKFNIWPLLTLIFAALFGRVNQELGAKLRKATEAKVKN